MTTRVTVVGNGVAGYACARRLAELGAAPVMIGPGLPHDRPPLSKRALEHGRAPLLADRHELVAQGIHHVDGMVEAVDLAGRTLRISPSADGEPVDHAFERLVWATGLRAVAPPVPGIDGAHENSTPGGMRALAEATATAGRDIVVIGAGLIGCETAATLARRHRVSLVDMAPAPVERLGPIVSNAARAALDGAGVRFAGACTIDVVHAGAIETASHGTIGCDVAVLAAGVRTTVPDELGSGYIDVDEHLLAVDLDDVWACGDVARFPHPRYGRLAVPHWDNARAGGRHAAESVMGSREPYRRDPYWFSDIGSLRIQQVGVASAAVEWIENGGLCLGIGADGRPACVLLIDAPRRLLEARALIAA